MAIGTFPELATNFVYTVLCLVPGFVTLKTVLHVSQTEIEFDQFDKTAWSLIGSGISLSVLYFSYVAWTAIVTGRLALVVPIDLQWTELVAAYPLLLGVAVLIGYLIGHLIVRIFGSSGTAISASERERSTE